MVPSLKGLHDRLLAEKPEGAVHDEATCPLCAIAETPDGTEAMSTYTEDELKAKVAEAVKTATAELEAKVAELTTAAQTSEVEQAKAELKAEFEPQITELQQQLDEKVLEAQNAATERDAIKAWLDAEAAAAGERQTIEARKAERLAKVKEVANFPDDYLTKHADRFAAMSDEDFAVACEGWAAIGGKPGGDTIPNKTALHAGRESEGSAVGSATKELFAMRREHGHMDLTGITR